MNVGLALSGRKYLIVDVDPIEGSLIEIETRAGVAEVPLSSLLHYSRVKGACRNCIISAVAEPPLSQRREAVLWGVRLHPEQDSQTGRMLFRPIAAVRVLTRIV